MDGVPGRDWKPGTLGKEKISVGEGSLGSEAELAAPWASGKYGRESGEGVRTTGTWLVSGFVSANAPGRDRKSAPRRGKPVAIGVPVKGTGSEKIGNENLSVPAGNSIAEDHGEDGSLSAERPVVSTVALSAAIRGAPG
jgi:hypothetical protein